MDKNPLAVDLCRVALWLESHTAGKPLSFLDHRIRCGDSLVGVFDLAMVRKGIPDKAFDACQGDDKPTARAAAKVNREEKRGFQDLFAQRDSSDTVMIARHSRDMDAIPDDSPDLIRRKKELFEQAHRDPAWLTRKQAGDLWTAAFFQSFQHDLPIVTSAPLADLLDGRPIDHRLLARATVESARLRFFHWPLEFPETCSPRPSEERGVGGEGSGFDVILSNPPWERIKLQEQEFFAARDPRIATASNKAARKSLIDALPEINPTLHAEFTAAVHDADCLSKFLRQSDRYPLTAAGDINTYAVFAETVSRLLNAMGAAGMILPLGIITDDTTRHLFSSLVSRRQLISVTGFENEEHIFPAVDHRFKFCLFTITGEKRETRNLRLTFFTRYYHQLHDERRRFTLTPEDFSALNPNTRTCPVFRTRPDAELSRKIHQRVPVLVREDLSDGNSWGVSFMRMFDMSNDSHHFQLAEADGSLPLYEAKMTWQFDHRFTTYAGATQEQLNVSILPQPTQEQKADPAFRVIPRYWVDEGQLLNTLARPTQEEQEALASGSLKAAELLYRQRERAPKWLLAFRDITNATNERTSIFTLLPRTGVGNSAPVMFLGVRDPMVQLCLLGNLNAFTFDFCARQKIGGTHMNFFILQQLPALPPSFYESAELTYVASRVLELVYTADDMQPLAEAVLAQLGIDGWNVWFPQQSVTPHSPLPTPFVWNEERRSHLRAELDAWFARAYGLNRKQLRYILDPADLTPRELENILDPWEEIADPLDPAGYAARAAASDFPGETFRVLKEKEQARYGEYRTRRLVLGAWERLPAH